MLFTIVGLLLTTVGGVQDIPALIISGFVLVVCGFVEVVCK